MDWEDLADERMCILKIEVLDRYMLQVSIPWHASSPCWSVCAYNRAESIWTAQGALAAPLKEGEGPHAFPVLCFALASYRVGLGHRLDDEDVVQLVKKKVKTGEEGKGRQATKIAAACESDKARFDPILPKWRPGQALQDTGAY
eukprot:scaffold88523_cov20-Tisochrysis_lutea.AAC.1